MVRGLAWKNGREGIAKAGGLISERADPKSVFLFRYMPREMLKEAGVVPEVPTVITVDLSDAEVICSQTSFT